MATRAWRRVPSRLEGLRQPPRVFPGPNAEDDGFHLVAPNIHRQSVFSSCTSDLIRRSRQIGPEEPKSTEVKDRSDAEKAATALCFRVSTSSGRMTGPEALATPQGSNGINSRRLGLDAGTIGPAFVQKHAA